MCFAEEVTGTYSCEEALREWGHSTSVRTPITDIAVVRMFELECR